MKTSFDDFIREWINDKAFAERVINNPTQFPNIINGLYQVYRTHII